MRRVFWENPVFGIMGPWTQLGVSRGAPALRNAGVNSGLKLGLSRRFALGQDFKPNCISLKLGVMVASRKGGK
jgi:hypothetical protein